MPIVAIFALRKSAFLHYYCATDIIIAGMPHKATAYYQYWLANKGHAHFHTVPDDTLASDFIIISHGAIYMKALPPLPPATPTRIYGAVS